MVPGSLQGKNLKNIRSEDGNDFHRMYCAGYYVNIERNTKQFYWDYDLDRYVINVNEQTASKARRILRKEVDIQFKYDLNKNSKKVLDHLQDEKIKQKTWLNEDIRNIYEAMISKDLAFTLEAYIENQLVGGLVGISMGGLITVDTMYGLPDSSEIRSASKALFCQCVLLCSENNISYIDVENSHPENHPCQRLGEANIGIQGLRNLIDKHKGSYPFRRIKV
jgi:Leu/Phe-tRNA-protein transferase